MCEAVDGSHAAVAGLMSDIVVVTTHCLSFKTTCMKLFVCHFRRECQREKKSEEV